MSIQVDLLTRRIRAGLRDLLPRDRFAREAALRLPLPVRGLLGQRLHAREGALRAAAGTPFRREVPFRAEEEAGGFTLEVGGRVDALVEEGGELFVEEIKTVPFRDLFAEVPREDHLWQIRLYLHFLAGRGLGRAIGRLVWIRPTDGARREFLVEADEAGVRGYLARWARDRAREEERREARAARLRRAAADLSIPFETPRPIQVEMDKTVTASLAAGRIPFVTAPTGVGKTGAALAAALRFAGARGLQVLYLISRTTQVPSVLRTAEAFLRRGVDLRALALRNKRAMCLHTVPVCDRALCPHAARYETEWARQDPFEALLSAPAALGPDRLFEEGVFRGLCPYHLSLDLFDGADLIVADFNYVFDPDARLESWIGERGRRTLLLVDEAHALYPRARDAYSPSLSSEGLRRAARLNPGLARGLGDLADRLEREIGEMVDAAGVPDEGAPPSDGWPRTPFDPPSEGTLVSPDPAFFQDLFRSYVELLVLEGPPAAARAGEGPRGEGDDALTEMLYALSRMSLAVREAAAAAAPGPPAEGEPPPPPEGRAGRPERRYVAEDLEPYRGEDAAQEEGRSPEGPPPRVPGSPGRFADGPFAFLAAGAGGGEPPLFRALCLDPGRFIREALDRFAAAVALSATLRPLAFYRDLLGFPEGRTDLVELPSPFPRENRKVLVYPGIRTRWRSRARDFARLAETIRGIVEARRGHYAVFFPSFDYLEAMAREIFVPGFELLAQGRAMDEAAREAVRSRLLERSPPLLLLAVQGGILGEGVDYPAGALCGVLVVGPGLPRVCVEQELLRRRFERGGRRGFACAYLYPGMGRVIQSAGRVVRGPDEVGLVALIGERFAAAEYQALFPPDWHGGDPRELVTADPAAEAARFWAGKGFHKPS